MLHPYSYGKVPRFLSLDISFHYDAVEQSSSARCQFYFNNFACIDCVEKEYLINQLTVLRLFDNWEAHIKERTLQYLFETVKNNKRANPSFSAGDLAIVLKYDVMKYNDNDRNNPEKLFYEKVLHDDDFIRSMIEYL